MNKKSFVLYADQKEIIDELDDEQAGKLFKAIYEYNATGKTSLTGILKSVFTSFKITFDRDEKKWEDIKQKRSEAGKRGMESRWGKDDNKITNDNKRYQTLTNITDSVSVSVSDSVSVSGGEYKSSPNSTNTEESIIFNTLTRTPTLSDVVAYGQEIGADDKYCEKFYDNYEGVGWINANGLQIKNWKAVFRNWFKKDLDAGKVKDVRKKQIDPDRVLEDEDGKLYKQNYDGSRYYI